MSRVAAILLAAMSLAACIDSSRVNDTCSWSDTLAGPLDLNTRAGREHLRIDVEVANELMVRYGDAHAAHRPDLQRPYRQRCITALSATISARHRVTALQIRAAEQERNWWADAFFVLLPMALLAVFVTSYVTRRIRQSFDDEDRAIAAVSAGVLAAVVAALSMAATNIWAFSVEGWRLRNGHVSHRAFFIPIVTHAWACAGFAAVLCMSAAFVQFRRTSLAGTSDRSYGTRRRGRP
jgi:hypothetical protein